MHNLYLNGTEGKNCKLVGDDIGFERRREKGGELWHYCALHGDWVAKTVGCTKTMSDDR